MQHTVAAIQKNQWRLGFIGWRRGTGVKSSPLTWSAPIKKRDRKTEGTDRESW